MVALLIPSILRYNNTLGEEIMPKTMFEKIWDAHVVREEAGPAGAACILTCTWSMK